jgi:beta-glucanase (GH16 family)
MTSFSVALDNFSYLLYNCNMSAQESYSGQPLSRRHLLAGASMAALGMLTGCGKGQPGPSPGEVDPNDPLDFSDQPDGPIDTKVWSFDLNKLTPTYNQEAQVYTDRHATIQDGSLVIDAIRTASGYESSRINTQGKFSLDYGSLTVRAKLPKGVGTWPAVWLLPEDSMTPDILKKHGLPNDTDDDYYYVWGGEIDVLETVGSQADPVNNQPTAHTYNSRRAGPDGATTAFVPVPDGQQAFHDYGLHKAPGLLEFSLDGKVVQRITRKPGDSLADWPYDDYRYYLVANLAMGGSWGGERRDEFPPDGIDDSQAPWKLEIAGLHFRPL